MTGPLLIHLDRAALGGYVRSQIKNLLPLPQDDDLRLIDVHLDDALIRTGRCIDQVKLWRAGEFDVLHSSQYCIFLYYLANTLWRTEQQRGICTKLFLLNKALNAIDCFYEIELPEVFFIGHSVGIVLAKATYGNHLVLYQNSTVGKNHGAAPVLEDRVVMYPNTAIIGNCLVRRESIIGQGVSVIGRETPGNCLVFQGSAQNLLFKPQSRPILRDFFRDL